MLIAFLLLFTVLIPFEGYLTLVVFLDTGRLRGISLHYFSSSILLSEGRGLGKTEEQTAVRDIHSQFFAPVPGSCLELRIV